MTHDYAWHVNAAKEYYADPANADNYLAHAHSYDMTTTIATLSATEGSTGVKEFAPDAVVSFTEIALSSDGLITANGDMLTIVRMNSREEILAILAARRASQTYYEEQKEAKE